MVILTDIELRSHWFTNHEKTYLITSDTVLTPAAKDFVREHGIELVLEGEIPQRQTTQKAMPMDADPAKFITDKPEDMTHLRAGVLVDKGNPQIAFRGKLDSLEAKILEVQVIARQHGYAKLVEDLEELLAYVKKILSAEVLDHPLEEIHLLGMDSARLRYVSQHVQEVFGFSHPVPNHTMGTVCVALNELRTFVRETELYAVHAFAKGKRNDIVEGLNRMSSCVYILFCSQLSHQNLAENEFAEQEQPILVEVSGRHVHLTTEAIEALFGKTELTKRSDLSQPGQFAATERVTVMTSKGEFENVAVLGPARKEVQVELSLTDARMLGIEIPVNLSGNFKGAADVILVGPNGMYAAAQSAICSKAHIHMTNADAKAYGVKNNDCVAVRLDTQRPLVMEEVVIRVSDDYSLAMHIDHDEANAGSFKKGDAGYILHPGKRCQS